MSAKKTGRRPGDQIPAGGDLPGAGVPGADVAGAQEAGAQVVGAQVVGAQETPAQEAGAQEAGLPLVDAQVAAGPAGGAAPTATRVVVCVGPGGVGKTTAAAALALRGARSGSGRASSRSTLPGAWLTRWDQRCRK